MARGGRSGGHRGFGHRGFGHRGFGHHHGYYRHYGGGHYQSCDDPTQCCTTYDDVPISFRKWITVMTVLSFIVIITAGIGLSKNYNKYNAWHGHLPSAAKTCF